MGMEVLAKDQLVSHSSQVLTATGALLKTP